MLTQRLLYKMDKGMMPILEYIIFSPKLIFSHYWPLFVGDGVLEELEGILSYHPLFHFMEYIM